MIAVETIARDFIEAWNRRDWAGYLEMLHPEYSYTGGDGERRQGPEAGMAVARMFANAFPDGRIEVQHIHTSGITAIVEFVGHGTHQGEFMGVQPTGYRVEIPVCNVLQIREGKVYAERQYMDMLHLMQQLGVAAVPTAA